MLACHVARFLHCAGMIRTFVLLLVEDDRVLGFVTAEALRLRGHTVEWATSVATARERLKERSDYHAMLLDLDLGVERGEAIVECLQTDRARLPEIIILSAQPMDVLLKTQRALNACGLLQKPSSVEDIDRELQRCIPMR